jgi:hypothetical protein
MLGPLPAPLTYLHVDGGVVVVVGMGRNHHIRAPNSTNARPLPFNEVIRYRTLHITRHTTHTMPYPSHHFFRNGPMHFDVGARGLSHPEARARIVSRDRPRRSTRCSTCRSTCRSTCCRHQRVVRGCRRTRSITHLKPLAGVCYHACRTASHTWAAARVVAWASVWAGPFHVPHRTVWLGGRVDIG